MRWRCSLLFHTITIAHASCQKNSWMNLSQLWGNFDTLNSPINLSSYEYLSCVHMHQSGMSTGDSEAFEIALNLFLVLVITQPRGIMLRSDWNIISQRCHKLVQTKAKMSDTFGYFQKINKENFIASLPLQTLGSDWFLPTGL